jgi:hypothetical protein
VNIAVEITQLSRRHIAHDEDRLFHTDPAQAPRLGGGVHAEPVQMIGGDGCDFGNAMAVGVRFHDSEKQRIGGKNRAKNSQVVTQRGAVELDPLS